MGGGSSGGGGSGKIDYPLYLKGVHAEWLANSSPTIANPGTNTNTSMAEAINQAHSNNPYVGESAYDPTTKISEAEAAVCAFNAIVDALSYTTDWQTAIVTADSKIDDIVSGVTTLSASATAIDVISALDFSSRLSGKVDFVSAVATAYSAMSAYWQTPVPAASAYISAAISAHAELLDEELSAKAYPSLEAGIRDINAIQSSYFTTARAQLLASRNRDLSKFSSELQIQAQLQRDRIMADYKNQRNQIMADLLKSRDDVNVRITLQRNEIYNRILEVEARGAELMAQAAIEQDRANFQSVNIINQARYELEKQRRALIIAGAENMLGNLMSRVELEKAVAHYMVEVKRLGIIAQREYIAEQIELEEKEATWDLEVYMYGANLLAAVSGGVPGVSQKKGPSKGQSALSGALAGMSIGASIGNVYGAVIGLVVGGIAGWLMG